MSRACTLRGKSELRSKLLMPGGWIQPTDLCQRFQRSQIPQFLLTNLVGQMIIVPCSCLFFLETVFFSGYKNNVSDLYKPTNSFTNASKFIVQASPNRQVQTCFAVEMISRPQTTVLLPVYSYRSCKVPTCLTHALQT